MTTIHKRNKMNSKKIIIALMLAIVPIITFAQSSFDEFEDMEDVSTVVVTKKAFELMARFDSDSKEAKEYVNMIKNLNSLRVFATENASIAAKMKAKVNG